MKPDHKIDDYIKTFPEQHQEIMTKIRDLIHSVDPNFEEAMTYGIPTFKLNGKNGVHFGGFDKHIGFYPTPSGISAFISEIKEFKHAKGSVQFPLNKPIPYDLIKRLVRFRVKEVVG